MLGFTLRGEIGVFGLGDFLRPVAGDEFVEMSLKGRDIGLGQFQLGLVTRLIDTGQFLTGLNVGAFGDLHAFNLPGDLKSEIDLA